MPRSSSASCSGTGRNVEDMGLLLVFFLVLAAGNGQVAAAIDDFFQLLAHFEEGQALGRHVDRLAGAGVSARVGLVRPHREAAETTDLDSLAALQGLRHRVK